uniref:Uncharacterized protein n=1 Tax=Anguilla anguilla TaxID=7936 RepID=A0A0E9R526_ANGAN
MRIRRNSKRPLGVLDLLLLTPPVGIIQVVGTVKWVHLSNVMRPVHGYLCITRDLLTSTRN